MAGRSPRMTSLSPKTGSGSMDALTSAIMVRMWLSVGASRKLTLKGHAGAMLQARRLGTELLVGIHSDEDILENKGPTVMTLQERCVTLEELELSMN
jgi:phosphopantetheine adenylyltransferase